jgi:hypothetical protein
MKILIIYLFIIAALQLVLIKLEILILRQLDPPIIIEHQQFHDKEEIKNIPIKRFI